MTRYLFEPELDNQTAVDFAWNHASPKAVFTIRANRRIVCVRIVIDTAFDGVGASLSVGDAGDAERLMAASEIDPAQAATFAADVMHEYATATEILLAITPGAAATQGAGTLIIDFEQEESD